MSLFSVFHPITDGQPESGPSKLNTAQKGQFLAIENEGNVVKYVGTNALIKPGHDVGCIQSDHPIRTDVMMDYFEVRIISTGKKGNIGIGFTPEGYLLTRHPGWDTHSYGYHGNDGHKYSDSEIGLSFGPKFGTGDVVGCGIDYEKRQIFFTKNGEYLGTAFSNVRPTVRLYPSVGMRSKGETVEVNFTGKFMYDIERSIQEEKDKMLFEIERTPAFEVGQVNRLIYSYLLNYGHAGTLHALEGSLGMTHTPDVHTSKLNTRKKLRDMVIRGDVQQAIQECDIKFPGLLKSDKDVYILMHGQVVIELVRNKQVENAINYASDYLADVDLTDNALLLERIGLIAYDEPEKSPLKHVMDPLLRLQVADALNARILVYCQYDPTSLLERCLQQLVVCHQVKREENGGVGEIFKLNID